MEVNGSSCLVFGPEVINMEGVVWESFGWFL